VSNPDIRHVSYPLALTVQYERNEVDGLDCDSGQPHGFAVICLGDFVVHKEPVREGSPWDVDRIDLERAAAGWLARIAGEAAAR
jgi:hypothetical protein